MESLSTSTRISYKKIRKDSKKYNQVSCLQKHQLIELILSDEYTIRKVFFIIFLYIFIKR